MNTANVVHGEEDKKIDLDSNDFLIEKAVEDMCKCY